MGSCSSSKLPRRYYSSLVHRLLELGEGYFALLQRTLFNAVTDSPRNERQQTLPPAIRTRLGGILLSREVYDIEGSILRLLRLRGPHYFLHSGSQPNLMNLINSYILRIRNFI